MRVAEKVCAALVLTAMVSTMDVCAAAIDITVEPKVKRIERPVAPGAVSRIGGFLGARLAANVDGYLRVFDIDRYVPMVEEKKHRDWWWIGEQLGKWLESAVLAAEQSGDKALREKAEKVLARLVAAQEPGGYLGITDPAVRTERLPLRGMDAYELYFMLHGLLTAHELWGKEAAVQTAQRLGDYFVDKVGPGKAEFWPRPKGETISGHIFHCGLEGTLLADPMLRLYLTTGNEKYLKWSRWVIGNIDRWSGHNTFSKLDEVAGGTLGVHELQPRVHAHTLHMNLLGFLRLYQITGNESLLRKVRGAWRDIASRQTYITGGVSVDEYYRPGGNLPITGSAVETCAMMSWIELSHHLLELTADPVYADAIERLLWNHLFAAQTVDGEVFRYHTPLNGTKPAGYFHGPDCCTASGPRIAAKIPTLIYAVGKGGIYINQFVDSRAEIRLNSGNIVRLTQETDYPSGGRIIFKVELQKAAPLTLHVRLPAWCESPSLSVNGEAVGALKPGTYARLDREWKKGDRIRLSLPMRVQWVKRSHTSEDLWALTRGPVVYAVDTILWDERAASALGEVPKDLSRVIGLVLDESNANTELEAVAVPAGALGPAYCVGVALPNGKEAEVTAWPFANVGRWYSDTATKPDREERRYAYAVWLRSAKRIPAFPGAEGAGAFTRGGRGGKVIQVTNLNDSGPGSLREAVEADGPRIVVFRVSGIITLEEPLAITNPFITIAGQKAPGDGICIRGQTTEINTHDVALRYLRFRRGNIKDRNDALGGYPVGNIIVDHCSVSWGLDENLSLYRYMKKRPEEPDKKSPVENLTIQWCISSEALDLNNHAFGGTWGGRNGSFHHNLFACNTGRNPSIGWGDHFDFRNNVLFNWRHRTIDGGDGSSMVNIVANYFKPGPATNQGASQYRICRPQHLDMFSEAQRKGKWYVAENFVVGNPKVTAHNWAGGVQFDDVQSETQKRELIQSVRATTPVPAPSITQQSAEEACGLVLAEAGATLPRRDAVDARIIQTVRTGKPTFGNGIIDTPADVGGWPDYKSAAAPADSDHDGMPDEWEKRFGLNLHDPSDGARDTDRDGHTNVEEWLNDTDPTLFVDYRNPENNVSRLRSQFRCSNTTSQTPSRAQDRAGWMKEGRWGVMNHYLADWIARREGIRMSVEEWNDLIDHFDVEGLAKQIESVGAGYHLITIGQNSGYYLSPNATYDRYIGVQPSRCSRRDLLADLYEALHKRGIKLMVYLPSGAPGGDRVAREALEWKNGPYRNREFQLKWEQVIREWSVRWGEKVVGWWFDGCYWPNTMYRSKEPPNFASFAAAARAGNADSVVAFNPGVVPRFLSLTPHEDYTAGEINDLDRVEIRRAVEGKIDGAQVHILSFLGQRWGMGEPRFSTEQVLTWSRRIADSGGVITWDVPIEHDGTISQPFIDQLTAVGKALGRGRLDSGALLR